MSAAGEQLNLFGSGAAQEAATGWWTGLPERQDAARYLHLIRGQDDPEREPRADRRATRWRSVNDIPVSTWARDIEQLLSDGQPRTFNRIALELTGLTADIVFEENPDHGLWYAVEQGSVLYTAEVPVLFRSADAL